MPMQAAKGCAITAIRFRINSPRELKAVDAKNSLNLFCPILDSRAPMARMLSLTVFCCLR
jgi:hypothetical protein